MEALLGVMAVGLVMATAVGVSLCMAAKRGDQQREKEHLHARLVAISRQRRDWYLD